MHRSISIGNILLLALIVAAAACLTACTETSPNGELTETWQINGTIAHNGISKQVDVFIEIIKDDQIFVSGLVFVDDQQITSIGDGTYAGSFDPDSLESPSLLRISTPVDDFQFQYQVQVPQPFTAETVGLSDDQVFSNTMVNVEWTPALPIGSEGGYILLARQTTGSMTAVGYQETLNGTQGTIPTDAFRDLNDEFQPGFYDLWVIARADQPISWNGLPVTFDDSVFSENVDRVGVSGQIGALYIPPPLEVTAVATTQP